MELNLWVFLSISVAGTSLFLIILVIVGHQQKMKQLEVDAIKAEKANIQSMVESELSRQISEYTSRLEILEAIVTDKNYELSEKITRLQSN